MSRKIPTPWFVPAVSLYGLHSIKSSTHVRSSGWKRGFESLETFLVKRDTFRKTFPGNFRVFLLQGLLVFRIIWRFFFLTWWHGVQETADVLLSNWTSAHILTWNYAFQQYCSHFQLVQWGKYPVFVRNTGSAIVIPVIQRYLRNGKGKNWCMLSAVVFHVNQFWKLRSSWNTLVHCFFFFFGMQIGGIFVCAKRG